MESILLDLTHGELGFLLRNMRVERKLDEASKLLLRVACPKDYEELESLYFVKEGAALDLNKKIRDLAYRHGDREKIELFEKLEKQYMKAHEYDPETKKHMEQIFTNFIRDDENLRLALVDERFRKAHLRLREIMGRD